MKENLNISEFSLKRIVENLDRIPRNGKFDNDVKRLTPEEKKRLMELVSKFNEYGDVLRCEQALMDVAKTLDEIAKMAETYAVTESSDWFQSKVVERDFKNVKKTAADFKKLAQECYGNIQQLSALYEDMGHTLSRYYEIRSLDEMAMDVDVEVEPKMDLDKQSQEVDKMIGKMQNDPTVRPSPFDK
jgi:DNA-binding transcriptional regulator GbsR (MarR family)